MKFLGIKSIAQIYFVLLLSFALAFIIILLFAPSDIRGVESNVIYSIQQVLRDNSLLYTNPENAPYAITQYSPLYYMLTDSILSVINLDVEKDFFKVRVIARLISLLTHIITFFLLNSLLVKQLKVDRQLAITYCLTFGVLSAPWFVLSRPDVLVTLFYVVAVHQVLKYFKSGDIRQLFWGGVACAFAVFSKQNGLFIFLSITAFLTFTLNIKGFLAIFTGLITGLVVCFSFFYLFGYSSSHLFENVVEGVNNGIDIGNFLFKTINTSATLHSPILITAIVVSFFTYKYFANDIYLRCLTIVTGSLFVITTAAALKHGSAENYYIDCVVLSLVILAYCTTKIEYPEKKELIISISIWAALIYSTSIFTAQTFRYFVEVRDATKVIVGRHSKSEISTVKELDLFLERELKDGFFYSPDRRLRLRFPYKALFPQDEILYGELGTHARGIFSYEMLSNDIVDGNFKYYISEWELPYQLFGANLKDNFIFLHKKGKYNIYKNKNRM